MLVNPSSVPSTVGAKAAAQAMAANLISVEVRTPADNVRLTRMLFRIGINLGDVLGLCVLLHKFMREQRV